MAHPDDLTPEAAGAIADEVFGLGPVTASMLGGEADGNVVVTDRVGERFVLKVAAADAITADLELEIRVLQHLSARDLGFAVPRPVFSRSGQVLEVVDVGGIDRAVRLLTWLPGTMLVDIPHPPATLLEGVGEAAAALVLALGSFDDDTARRTHHWDMRTADRAIRDGLPAVTNEAHRTAVTRILGWYEAVQGGLADLPASVVHNDLNDFNVLVRRDPDGELHVAGVLDVGDALYTARVAEAAVAAAYVTLGCDTPVAAAARVIGAFHRRCPLNDAELAAVYPLLAARLCMNAVTWTRRLAEGRAGVYGTRRMRRTWPALLAVADVEPWFAEATVRAACGLNPSPRGTAVAGAVAQRVAVPMVDGAGDARPIDLSPGSPIYDGAHDAIASALTTHLAEPCVGGHGEARLDRAARRRPGIDEPATVHLGCDVFCASGTIVRAPVAGTVAGVTASGLVIHQGSAPVPFWVWVSGVDPVVVSGSEVQAGDEIGTVGCAHRELGVPHVHVQVSAVAMGDGSAPPAFVRPSERAVWTSVCPDPSALLGVSPARIPRPRVDEVVAVRARQVGRSQRSYFRRPPHLVRAKGVWFTDEDGQQYLDALNNVTHVGHGHPRVVEAARRQMYRLNTNSRFVYGELAAYAERLTSLLPAPLDVVFFACTGSEANDLALRMARTFTGRQDVVVLDGAYHGNTTAVTAISPNRYQGAGGGGRPATTHEVPQPDRYRGPYGYDHPAPGRAYAQAAARIVDEMGAGGRPPAAVFAESLMGTAGEVVLPEGYLAALFDTVRAAGGLCVSDEVQVGFGRLGSKFWGFETHGVVPDIVTMGKPMGNGHPMAAVVTSREIADAFDNGMKYFNTFAGNPVSCAVGMAVLDVIEEEDLQQRAGDVGTYLLSELEQLRARHSLLGDVRGEGLYAGVELVRDRATKEPATTEAYAISESMKDAGVITYPNGRYDNILKFKPPMVFGREHADLVVEVLDHVLVARGI